MAQAWGGLFEGGLKVHESKHNGNEGLRVASSGCAWVNDVQAQWAWVGCLLQGVQATSEAQHNAVGLRVVASVWRWSGLYVM